MRLAESTIKAAILHPEEEARLTAVSYFSGSFSQDEAVMPLVIQAVERYGRDKAFRILRNAERLSQTQATVDWLLNGLRQDYALEDVEDDNYRFAIALILYGAPPDVLLQRQAELAALPMFPDQLRGPLDERLDMLSWDWNRGWAALEAFGQNTMRKGSFTWNDVRYADRIIESLARHRATRAASVLNLLQRQHEGGNEALMEWLKPLMINLTGAMQIESAIPVLIKYLPDNNVSLSDESTTALIKINTDAVVWAIADKWWDADTNFRGAASDVLEHIHTDFCAERCLKFFSAEEHPETRLSLAHAVLSQFIEEGVEPVRQLVLAPGDKLSPNGLDIRYRLAAACAVMGVLFPELEQWHEGAVANNWGLGDYKPPRLADTFRPDQPAPKRTGNRKEY